MAEETLKPAAAAPSPPEPSPLAEEVVAAVETTPEKPPVPESEQKSEPVKEEEERNEKPKEETTTEEEVKIVEPVSFKEETNVASKLPESQKKALDDLKRLIQDALNNHQFTSPPPLKEEEKKTEEKVEEKVETKGEEDKAPDETTKPSETAEETVVEKVTAIDEDGAKTVEAIEETVVAVSSEPAAAAAEEETPVPPPSQPEEVSIWGIPLLADERSDVILLKFLRARDFKVKDAFTMIKNTVRWRKEFGIEAIVEEDFGSEYEKMVFMHGFDKEGHPVCYNVYGAFRDKELYQNCFSDEEKRVRFLRWRIRFLEKSIRTLDFSPTGINTIVQVNDLKNSPGPAKKERRQATNQAVNLLQDNYPEFVAKQMFINVPWWYLAFNKMISPFLTQRTKSKFVISGPTKSAETLFKYIVPEQVPVQFGGLSKEGEQEFAVMDSVMEVVIKPTSKHSIEFFVSEKLQLVWELRVVGGDVSYGAEFVPATEDGYTVIVSKTRKVTAADEPVIGDTFKTSEPGKIVITVDNQTSKKKKLLYRSKTKPLSD